MSKNDLERAISHRYLIFLQVKTLWSYLIHESVNVTEYIVFETGGQLLGWVDGLKDGLGALKTPNIYCHLPPGAQKQHAGCLFLSRSLWCSVFIFNKLTAVTLTVHMIFTVWTSGRKTVFRYRFTPER